jgi:hypothetical protein
MLGRYSTDGTRPLYWPRIVREERERLRMRTSSTCHYRTRKGDSPVHLLGCPPLSWRCLHNWWHTEPGQIMDGFPGLVYLALINGAAETEATSKLRCPQRTSAVRIHVCPEIENLEIKDVSARRWHHKRTGHSSWRSENTSGWLRCVSHLFMLEAIVSSNLSTNYSPN